MTHDPTDLAYHLDDTGRILVVTAIDGIALDSADRHDALVELALALIRHDPAATSTAAQRLAEQWDTIDTVTLAPRPDDLHATRSVAWGTPG